MKLRPLGNSGLEVSKLCLGGNVFGWTADKATSFQILDAFVEAGGNFIDTADMYSRWAPGHSGGESETIIGEWMKARGNRKKIILATKVGMEMGPKQKGLSMKYIMSAVESSLKRLQTDYIDLYIAHKDDEETPLEETLEAFSHVIEGGKARVIGASNYNGKRLHRAIEEVSLKKGLPAYQSLQPHYNLYDRADYEKDLLPICSLFNLGVTPYFALASGFLTGKYRQESDFSKSPRGGSMGKFMNERGKRVLAALDRVAKDTRSSPTQVSLAWLMYQPTVTSPIASATSVAQLSELIASTELKLDGIHLELLDQA